MSRSNASYHHGDLVAALEQAAFELLAEQGHASLSLREVARRAGVSHNAPYHHFGDRSALLHHLAEAAMSRLLAAQQAALARAEGADAVERAVALGVAYTGWAVANPNAFAVIFDPAVCVPGQPTGAMGPLIAENERILATTIKALIGSDAGDGGIASVVSWSSVHGLAQLVTAGHVPESALEPAVRAVMSALAGSGHRAA
ncbi:TetR/AcrR family transcriptional regulator [Arenivirga flava]|uniref:TetR/AcrR family transcriptional regulator n=1 Tax=Arenivirga flava TaxID=1930060 RepID=UPI0024E11960|nr:TetR/AcrR family transcriptional regulator [Arenivirga flava]